MVEISITNDVDDRIRRELSDDEVLLWHGRPRQGLFLCWSEWLRFPQNLLLLALPIIWEASALTSDAPTEFRIVGAVFIGVGLTLSVGRLWGDAYERSRTCYGITDRRVIIVWGMLSQAVRSIPFEIVTDVRVRGDVDGTSTITFIRKWSIMSLWLNDRWNFYRMPGIPQLETYVPPAFEKIDDAERICEIVQKAWMLKD